jgi:histidine triad (HIT) family protein
MSCVFCEKIKTGDFIAETPISVMFEPLNPVTPGHRLVIPKKHVKDAFENAYVTGRVMDDAAYFAKSLVGSLGACNLITSVGSAATQSIFHLHIHIVPRVEGDGLSLPWTGQVIGQSK